MKIEYQEKNALQKYIKYISQFYPLPEEKQKELLKKYEKTKDEKLENKLFESNTRLVVKIACEVRNRYKTFLSTLELISEGNLGLLHAIQCYKSEKCKRKFSHYAGECIKGYIKRAVAEMSRRRNKEINLEEKNYAQIKEDNSKDPLEELIKKDRKEIVNSLLNKLSDARKEVTIKYYILEKTLEEIGEEMGRTHEAVRSRLQTSIRQMRKYLKNE